MKIHPAAEIFPPMSTQEYSELVESIRKNGLLEPVWFDKDGVLLDGRHRVRACTELKIPYKKQTYEGDLSPVDIVWALNGPRRHLTQSQKGMVAARARKFYDDEAKERQHEGQKAGGRGNKKLGGKSTTKNTAKSREAAGKAFGVSGSYVERGTCVLQKGTPELIAAVDSGKLCMSRAAQIAGKPKEQQNAEIEKYPYKKKNATVMVSEEPEQSAPEIKGVGVIRANEAINSLARIPKNDGLRERGLKMVIDWCRKQLKG